MRDTNLTGGPSTFGAMNKVLSIALSQAARACGRQYAVQGGTGTGYLHSHTDGSSPRCVAADADKRACLDFVGNSSFAIRQKLQLLGVDEMMFGTSQGADGGTMAVAVEKMGGAPHKGNCQSGVAALSSPGI